MFPYTPASGPFRRDLLEDQPSEQNQHNRADEAEDHQAVESHQPAAHLSHLGSEIQHLLVDIVKSPVEALFEMGEVSCALACSI
jgi:hypothetical protein